MCGLEHPQQCSVCDYEQWNWMKEYAGLAWGNWFCPYMFTQFAEAGKRHNKSIHVAEKSVINVIWLFLPVSDWLIIMIGPGGLISVVSHLSSPSYWRGCENVNNWEIFLQGGVVRTARDGVACDVTLEMLALRKQKSTNFSPVRHLKESHNECYVLLV
jgi:hypothetical protein